MTSGANLIRTILENRSMVFAFAVRDLQGKYAGTLGQGIWMFAHPLAIIVIYYYVFAVGFRAQGPEGVPFILWFVCGLIPWFFFAETLQSMTNAITGNVYLVKKIVFPTELLAIIHLISGMIPHAVFLIMLTGMLIFYNIPFEIERMIFLYYFMCSCMLLLGLGWLLSALQVFYRDIGQALTIILNMLFWLTPIVWSLELLPNKYHHLISYNPLFYIIEGYRGAMVYEHVIYPSVADSLYFWSVMVVILLIGKNLFMKLKPEFSDVL